MNEGEYFNIPEYQRGYKWSAQSITKLLNDIDSFETNGDTEKFYCLQNITIVCKEDKDGKEYNVVDGQQRLTTLSILFKGIKTKNTKTKTKNADFAALTEAR